jgi:hypothetical protein
VKARLTLPIGGAFDQYAPHDPAEGEEI